MIHWLPKALREKFVAEHPVQAAIFVLFGFCMVGFMIWLAVTK